MFTNRLVLVFAFLTLLMGGLALFFGVRLSQTTATLALTNQQVLERDRMLFRQERAHQHEVTTTDEQLPRPDHDAVKVEPPAAAVFADELCALTGDDLSNLMKAGLPADPEAFLRADLARQLPHLATTPDPPAKLDDARILTPNLALARWRDGHGSGVAVLRYRVTGAGTVSWRLLDWGAGDHPDND